MSLTIGHFLTLGGILFAFAAVGIFLNRKNLIVLLMCVELMLLAVNSGRKAMMTRVVVERVVCVMF